MTTRALPIETRTKIIFRRRGQMPDTRLPAQNDEGTAAMLREIYKLYPDATAVVVDIVGGWWGIHIKDGKAWLAEQETRDALWPRPTKSKSSIRAAKKETPPDKAGAGVAGATEYDTSPRGADDSLPPSGDDGEDTNVEDSYGR